MRSWQLQHDALVGLTVDHHLPAAGTHGGVAVAQGQAFSLGLGTVEVLAVFLDPAGQAPLFKEMDGVVNVTAEVEDEVVANDVHEVGADHADVVVDVVFTDVGVDGGQTLGNGAGALEGGLVKQHHSDGRINFFDPAGCFKSNTAVTHPAADHQDVNILFDDLRLAKFNTFGSFVNGKQSHVILLRVKL